MSAEASCTVEVSNLLHRATQDELHRLLSPLQGFVSLSYTPRSGKAVVELSSRAHAEVAVRTISSIRELAYAPAGQTRTLRAAISTAASSGAAFRQDAQVKRWPFEDPSALPSAQQKFDNHRDLEKLFDNIGEGPMRDSLWTAVQIKEAEGLVLKEMYLAKGRQCELVFAGSNGQRDTYVARSDRNGMMVDDLHIGQFAALFADMPAEARRTGIDDTLHRVSRSVHAIARKATAIERAPPACIRTCIPHVYGMCA